MTQSTHSRASKKVPDGKLVRVDVEYSDVITTVAISGDFFIEPPTARTDLESVLEGQPLDVECETLINAIEDVDATLIGFDATDLADATCEALP